MLSMHGLSKDRWRLQTVLPVRPRLDAAQSHCDRQRFGGLYASKTALRSMAYPVARWQDHAVGRPAAASCKIYKMINR